MNFLTSGRFTDALPADTAHDGPPRQVTGAAYSPVQPDPVSAPRLLAWSDEMADVLGVERPGANDALLQQLAGNQVPAGSQPYAMCYGGHQFGHWAGQLGDGRVINYGELRGRDGRRWELQLKGAGPTPYSRTADGRAVLRSSLREFICSEAMHAMGVPTSRALSLVGTGDCVVRDMFYDGNPQPEPGAIVCRVAPSFIRFGSFELPASRGDTTLLQQFVDYTVRTHFPDIDADAPDAMRQWFSEVCRRTAVLMVHWMRVGFVHGVMNTDNLSIHGITIDYGPYGWLEPYDPAWTPNTTDLPGRRYSFGKQPQIAQWNLSKLGSALAQLTGDPAPLQAALDDYARVYSAEFERQFAAKLGLNAGGAPVTRLLNSLFEQMSRSDTDYCILFRRLAQVPVEESATDAARLEALKPAFYAPESVSGELEAAWQAWLAHYAAACRNHGAQDRVALMDRTNPILVPRNYLAQQAIDAAEQGDLAPLQRLQDALSRPYAPRPSDADLTARRPDWARDKAGCSALSCSS